MLKAYFRSGWAFLIPYLTIYLLYAWLKWPVNPVDGRSVPSLLTAFWALHVLHAMLAVAVLIVWWRGLPSEGRMLPTAGRLQSQLLITCPWLMLGLLIQLPGVYWEFPSDVWEHFSRINDYGVNSTVMEVGTWRKSSYFLAYSFLGSLPTVDQIRWLNLYNTVMCLLLCWQYYRLAKAVGLSRPPAFLFVVLQGLLLGNSSFSFYRYYGISSSIVAQIAAIAFMRGALKVCHAPSGLRLRQIISPSALCAGSGLLVLMALNHLQALGLALLSLTALIPWRAGLRSLPWYLAGVVLASVLLVAWWPADALPLAAYRAQGWLSQFYGFNLLAWDSVASARGVQILGSLGITNLAAAIYLLKRNHPAGWLTIFPVTALLCPLFVLPFATLLARTSPEYIVVFPRMLLGIPAGLALVVVAQEFYSAVCSDVSRRGWSVLLSPFPVLTASLLACVTLPASAPHYNRSWHAWAIPPADLSLAQVIDDIASIQNAKLIRPLRFVSTDSVGFAAHASGVRRVIFNYRLIAFPIIHTPAAAAQARLTYLHESSWDLTLYVPLPLALFSTESLAGRLSGHWNPREVALGYTAGPEIERLMWERRVPRQVCRHGTLYEPGD